MSTPSSSSSSSSSSADSTDAHVQLDFHEFIHTWKLDVKLSDSLQPYLQFVLQSPALYANIISQIYNGSANNAPIQHYITCNVTSAHRTMHSDPFHVQPLDMITINKVYTNLDQSLQWKEEMTLPFHSQVTQTVQLIDGSSAESRVYWDENACTLCVEIKPELYQDVTVQEHYIVQNAGTVLHRIIQVGTAILHLYYTRVEQD